MARNRVVRRSFSGGRGGGARRQTQWLGVIPTSTTIAGGTGAVLVNSLNAAALALRPFTIVRCVGELYIISDQQAASELQGAAYGSAVVSDQAVAIGVTAIPTPFTDISSDLWFLYQAMWNSFAFGDATGFANEGTRYPYDSRAMRKVEEGEDVVGVIETSGITNGVTVFNWGRMLIKLH